MQRRAAGGTGSTETSREFGTLLGGHKRTRRAELGAPRTYESGSVVVAPRCYVTGPDQTLVETEQFDQLAREKWQVSDLVENEIDKSIGTRGA